MILRKVYLFGLVFALCGVLQAASSVTETSAARLGREIAAAAGSGAASLSIRNQSSLSNEEIPGIRAAVEAELRSKGIQIRTGGAAAIAIRVTLSENVQSWFWIAEIQQGDAVRVVMVPVPRPMPAPGGQSSPNVILRQTLIFSQPEPMLDAVVTGAEDRAQLLVLDATAVTLYRSNSGQWERAQSFPIRHSGAFPRDLRGRLIANQTQGFTAYLPGVVCTNTATEYSCHESDDPWPLGSQKAFFNSARNYFTGVLVPGVGRQTSPFFSASDLPRTGYSLWVFAGVDGSVRENDGVNERSIDKALTRDWGSDLTSVFSHCGLGTQLLVTASSDGPESLRAYEIADREPLLVSAPLAMEGPVKALWPSADALAATVIVQNHSAGRYEAYSVSIACSR